MVERFQDEKSLVEWVQQRDHETQSSRQKRIEYACRCRAYFNGIHWIKTGQGPDGFTHLYNAGQRTWDTEYQKNEPMQVTMNKITNTTLQNAAATNWTSMEISSLPDHGVGDPARVVDADILESIANMVIDMANIRSTAETANFERCIDAMHGVGLRLETGMYGENDRTLDSFDFDGYQLTLDPTVKSHDLSRHPYVIFTEIMTIHAARRMFGQDLGGIDESKLQTMAALLPVELSYHGMTGGRLYTHLSQVSSQKGVRVQWVFLKGAGKRFDRLYYLVDGVGPQAGKSVMNFNAPANPYGACGMPLCLKTGFMRPSEIFPISDVGLMIDDQDRLNAMASLYFQQVWDYTTNYAIIADQGWFGDNRATQTDMIEKMRGQYWIGKTNGNSRFQPPTFVHRPEPSQSLQLGMAAQESAVRASAFQSDLHVGRAKTHISDATNQTSLELVEAPIDDRRDQDVRHLNALIEVAVGTIIKSAQAQAPSMLIAMQDAGMNSTQIGRILVMNSDRLPAKLQINRESVRRRSRGQQKRDLIEIAQYGAHQDPGLRRALSEMDYPVFAEDKSVERWANQAVARLIAGDAWDAIPSRGNAELVLTALERGMRSDAARDPEVMDRIREAYAQQLEVEGMGGQQAEEPVQDEFPPEITMDQMFAGVAAPG